jgi:hypothetical protein
MVDTTYTSNLGIEKPVTGTQSGTWGETVNLNYDMFDQAINGFTTIVLTSAGTALSPNSMTITDGALSDARNPYLIIDDTGDLLDDVFLQLEPNTAQKIAFIKNSLTNGRVLHVCQGDHHVDRDYTIRNGNTALLAFSGEGASASYVTPVMDDFQSDGGIFLDNNEPITWRNAAGTADIELKIDGTDTLITTANIDVGDITGGDIAGGAITATSYGGITEANLVDKSATETISGLWTFGTITATTVNATTVAGIATSNLVDKSATETIDGQWTHTNGLFVNGGWIDFTGVSYFQTPGIYDGTTGAGGSAISLQPDNNVGIVEGNVVFTGSSKGCDYQINGTTSQTGASSTDQVFNHYDHGTWTPTLVSTGSGSANVTGIGTFVKTGRLVHVTGQVAIINLGTLDTAQLEIGQLPYSATVDGVASFGLCQFLNLTAGNSVTGRVSTDRILLFQWGDTGGVIDLTKSHITASGLLEFSANYIVG